MITPRLITRIMKGVGVGVTLRRVLRTGSMTESPNPVDPAAVAKARAPLIPTRAIPPIPKKLIPPTTTYHFVPSASSSLANLRCILTAPKRLRTLKSITPSFKSMVGGATTGMVGIIWRSSISFGSSCLCSMRSMRWMTESRVMGSPLTTTTSDSDRSS
ncbi:hypothetical protein BCR35DRAFT_298567 [Leucosporidium creatinivorum]|uniref:Uncharacterized protein n=1 Tax=Leucosporidium creatinivorum TaxID=106004 RepID=A0A1Y2G6H0_9BASI|nr:hypothetical protein BCR35DRAFT_298567 [Leucosporidium creatinivorum]